MKHRRPKEKKERGERSSSFIGAPRKKEEKKGGESLATTEGKGGKEKREGRECSTSHLYERDRGRGKETKD